MKEIKFFKHIGSLGDAFVINGLVHGEFVKDPDTHLMYLCNPKHTKTLKKLYEDSHNVSIIDDEVVFDGMYQSLKKAVACTNVLPWEYITTQVNIENSYWINWDRQIYEFYNVPFNYRYTKFRLPLYNTQSVELFNSLVEKGERYIVRHAHMNSVHETFVNYDISPFNPENLRIIDITPELSDNFLDYVTLLENAEQIHVTPSSVFCLVDSIHNLISAKKYIHLVRKDYCSQYNSFLNNFCWTPVVYSNKMRF
jgi:hypothetical protein